MTLRLGVLGGSGQVGTELIKLLRSYREAVVAPTSGELDIRDRQAVERWVEMSAADAIVNCAAYTAVERAETDREHAFAVNAHGPGHLGAVCATARIPVIHLSTDYVFSGDKTGSYDEDDEAHPLNVYGESKLAGERAFLEAGGDPMVLRVAWVFSAHGTNFVKNVVAKAAAGERLEVVDDQIGGPSSARSIAEALRVLASSIKGRGAMLYHFAAEPAVSRYEFAGRVIDRGLAMGLFRGPIALDPIATPFDTAVRRPANSRFSGTRLLQDFGIDASDWRSELDLVLTELRVAGDEPR